MKALKKLPTVLLWVVTVSSILLGLLALASALGFIRFATISDSSSSPTAFKWSLEIAQQVPAAEINDGDTILVGSHSAQGSTLGEVVHITKNENGTATVILKAPAFDTPDEWTYEITKTTHRHLIAIPLIGYPLEKISEARIPGLMIGIAALALLSLIIAFRIFVFRRNEVDGDPWFKHLTPEFDQDHFEVLGEMFMQGGATPPPIYSKKRWWSRMKPSAHNPLVVKMIEEQKAVESADEEKHEVV